MALTDLSSIQLARLVELIKEKETIQIELAQVERTLDALEKGIPLKEKSVLKKSGPRRGRRASLKDSIVKELQAVGKTGLTVKELAARIKAKPGSVSAWFYTTGKKILAIKKVGIARFAYIAG